MNLITLCVHFLMSSIWLVSVPFGLIDTAPSLNGIEISECDSHYQRIIDVAPVNVNYSVWMRDLNDSLPMCKISIPGTHDSGATKGGRKLKTQTLDIRKQLDQGIRAFDIRLAHRNKRLGVFHSHAFQYIYWEDNVLPEFLSFLKAHPSETLIVSLKKEGGSIKDYSRLLSVSLTANHVRDYIIDDFHPGMTLGQCRGKILFLHRDHAMDLYPGVSCEGWADNASGMLTLRSCHGVDGFALLQDEYQYESGKDASKKIEACIRNFENINALPTASMCWGVSFTSATALSSGTPLVFANEINHVVADFLAERQFKHCGIVFIDFVGNQGGRSLVDVLIKCNYQYDS